MIATVTTTGPVYGFHDGEAVHYKIFGPYDKENEFDVEVYVGGTYAFTHTLLTDGHVFSEMLPVVDEWFYNKYHEWEQDVTEEA